MENYLTDEEMDEIEIRFGAKHVEPKYKKGEKAIYVVLAILAVITAIMVGLS